MKKISNREALEAVLDLAMRNERTEKDKKCINMVRRMANNIVLILNKPRNPDEKVF
jgi:predicted GTPase